MDHNIDPIEEFKTAFLAIALLLFVVVVLHIIGRF